MHIHIGAVDFLVVSAYVIIFAFIWRSVSAYYHDNALGQAMAFIF